MYRRSSWNGRGGRCRRLGLLTLAAIGALGALLLAPPESAGQINPRFYPEDEARPATFTSVEVLEILISNGIDPEIAEEHLARFPEDRTYTESEIEIIVRFLQPTDETEEGAAREEMEPGVPDQVIPSEILYPRRLESRILKPFGFKIFRMLPAPTTPVEDITVGPEYVVGIGDEILITLWGDIQKRYAKIVDRQGRLVFPDAGVVMAAGRTLGELREELAAVFGQVYKGFRMTVSIGDVRTISVYVTGDVHRPGNYTLTALSTVFTALYHAGGPTLHGSMRKISLARRNQPLQDIDLYEFLLSGDRSMDVPLQSGDVVHIHPQLATVQVIGEVRRPGIYEIRDEETLRDVIKMAGGLTDLATREVVTVDRYSEIEGVQLHKIDWEDAAQNLTLAGGDEIAVYSVYQAHPVEFVEIHGQVQRPGSFRLVPGMRVTDLIYRAGGVTEGTYFDYAEVARLVETGGDVPAKTALLSVALGEVLADPEHVDNISLLKGDKLFVRTAPGWQPPPVVVVEGQVRFPGRYGLANISDRITDLIDRAGGVTIDAFPLGAQLFRSNKGRVIIDFSRALDDPQSNDNIQLADGDSIFVPRRPETVRVWGEVVNPGMLLYVPGKKASYYLQKTGGFTLKADKKSVRIIRVSGELESASQRFWSDPKVHKGDEIFVEAKEERPPIDWGKTLRETATIVASLAATVFVLANI